MDRTYVRRTAMAGTALGLAGLGAAVPGLSRALFDSRPLQQERFAVLAQAVGDNRWKLLVLEQIKARPLCWEERGDGLINPSLNEFDFSGICSRYLDSNGYSLRTGGADSDKRFRLKLEQNRRGLVLQAMDPVRGDSTIVARASRMRRDMNAFVKLTLEPGWALERRAYKGRTLSHVYFANAKPMPTLMASSRGSNGQSRSFSAGLPSAPGLPQTGRRGQRAQGPIRLEVIPFRP